MLRRFFSNKNGLFKKTNDTNASQAELIDCAERMYKYGMGPKVDDYFGLSGVQQNEVQTLIDELEDRFGCFNAPNPNYKLGSY